jgi:hypothetical protein
MGGAALPKYLSIGQSAGHRAGMGATFCALRMFHNSGVGTLLHRIVFIRPATGLGVRRGKAALSSGCKSHPATAPAGSNRSSHGGNEVAEASG